MDGLDPAFGRHVAACNTAALPGARLRLRIGADQVGWVLPPAAAVLAAQPGVRREDGAVVLDEAAAARLPELCRALVDAGLGRWRSELFDVRASPDGPVLAAVDRGSVPVLGILAVGAHLNGLVRKPDGLHLWVARRNAAKLLDPGKLDHLAAGGVAQGGTPFETLVREAWEEASLPESLARQATEVARIDYAMERPEGLRRDLLVCYDLLLPEDFVPLPRDGEVEAFELWPIARAVAAVRDTDAFKFNVNLVLIDLFRRLGLIR